MDSMDLVPHRFTVEEFERMDEAGVFDPDLRLELIEGEIVEVPPMNPPHASVVMRVNRLFAIHAGDDVLVTLGTPVKLPPDSEPLPDLMLLRATDDFYRSGHPLSSDVLLAVEVSDSTLRTDRLRKAPMYARRGIGELWIANVREHVLEVYRDPSPDGYRSVERVGSGGTVAVEALPHLVFAVEDILGPASS